MTARVGMKGVPSGARRLNTMMKEMAAIKDMASVLPIESLPVPGLNVVVD